MRTYGTPQYNNAKSGKRAGWPFPGTSAGELLKTSYRIMVASDLLKTTNFQFFYQDWTANLAPNEKNIFLFHL